jgi:hypothetical protein
MSQNELIQWIALAGGGVVVLALVYGIFRWSRKQDAIFPETAKHYGLEFTQDNQGSAFANSKRSKHLRGVVRGMPIHAASSYETRGRLTIKTCWVATAPSAGLVPCTINVTRHRPAASAHLVPSGDARFDAQRFLLSDSPDAVRRALTPAVRDTVLRCPLQELRIVVDQERVVVSFPGTPSSQAELQGLIDIALALGAP